MSFRATLIRATAALALAASGLAHAATQYVLLTPAPTACADAGCQVQQAKITGNTSPEPSATLLAEQHIRQIYAIATQPTLASAVNGAATESLEVLYDIVVPSHSIVITPSAFDGQGRITETTTLDFQSYVRTGISSEVCSAIHAKGLGAIDCAGGTLTYLANFALIESRLDENGNYGDYSRFVSITYQLTQAQVDAATPAALQAAPGQYQIAGI